MIDYLCVRINLTVKVFMLFVFIEFDEQADNTK